MQKAAFESSAPVGERPLAGRNVPQPMQPQARASRAGWIAPVTLILALILCGAALAWWKARAAKASQAAAANQPEPMESISVAVARPQEHRRTTTSIGTLVATRSITLRNELPGTIREVFLTPGHIVEAGTVLVAQDVSVEEAELKAQEAQAALADTLLSRMERAVQHRATSQMELDRARAERDVAQAQIARAKAIIARKTIRAPFQARIGMSDVHPGQYLEAGTLLTTLQGVDPGVFVDFTVTQQVGQNLQEGQSVEILASMAATPLVAKIIALDARTDPNTRNTWVRGRIDDAQSLPPPGASVRVRVPVGESYAAVAIPVSALRKGPSGDHVFVIAADQQGKTRAHVRPVQSGSVLGDEVLVLSGLKAGDQVAASGSFKLREGVLVVAAQPAPSLNVASTDTNQPAEKSVN
jgi:membrane fusion protein, multidrug efflux system